MPIHPHNRQLPQPERKCGIEPAAGFVAMAPSRAGSEQQREIHVQDTHTGPILLDSRRREPLPRLSTKSSTTATAPNRIQPPSFPVRAQERHHEPCGSKARESSYLALKSQSQHQHDAVLSRSAIRSGTYSEPPGRRKLPTHGVQPCRSRSARAHRPPRKDTTAARRHRWNRSRCSSDARPGPVPALQ